MGDPKNHPPKIHTMTEVFPSMPNLKAIVFDLMGTCCDWHSSILPALQASPAHHHPTSILPTRTCHRLESWLLQRDPLTISSTLAGGRYRCHASASVGSTAGREGI